MFWKVTGLSTCAESSQARGARDQNEREPGCCDGGAQASGEEVKTIEGASQDFIMTSLFSDINSVLA